MNDNKKEYLPPKMDVMTMEYLSSLLAASRESYDTDWNDE